VIHIQRIVANDFKQLAEVDLTLPRRGRFLVQGLNEAGKSTLFEAVYFALFGRPLATETAHARLDDVIRYGANEAWVEIVVGLDGGRSLRIMRRVRRGRPNVWELDVVTPGAPVEEVRGNNVVNDRIAAELKVDGEALLNTCFVEQKKLEKLEGMSRTQREQSLMKLLNLDRLVAMGDELRVRPADTAAVQRLADRAELARRQRELPEAEAELRRVERDLARAQACDDLRAALAEAVALAALHGAAEAARVRSEDLGARAARAAVVRSGLDACREARALRDRAIETTAVVRRLEAELAEACAARDVQAPRILARGTALRRLQARRDRLGMLAGEADVLEAALRADAEALDALAGERAAHARIAASLDATRSEKVAADRRARLELGLVAVIALASAIAGTVGWRLLLVITLGALVVLTWRVRVWAGRLGALTTALGRLEGEAAAIGRRAADPAATAAQVDAPALARARDARAARLAKIRQVIARRGVKTAVRAVELGIALEPGAIEDERGALRADLVAARKAAERVPELDRARAQARTTVTTHWSDAARVWSALPPVPGLPAWSGDLGDDGWDAAAGALRRAYEAAGGDAVRQAADEAVRAAARLDGQVAAARRTHDATIGALRGRLDALVPSPTADDLAGVLAALEPLVPAPAAELAAGRARAAERVNVARHEVRRLETLLGLAGEVIDAAVAQREHAAAARALAVRRKASDIVDQAGRNVVQRVLPSTLDHMRRLLPALTQDRYFDAQLSDDYRIEVFDDRAKAWKQKNIFSGGTRDQFSLALRLAFALATLPEERGTAPSFVFLDEPLGAFDAERARALIDLLVEGEIADSFDQIFLISHVRVDPELFDYRITLDQGRVAETNL
jgi:DNA repair exonuclease SbcCD ATPase subunit